MRRLAYDTRLRAQSFRQDRKENGGRIAASNLAFLRPNRTFCRPAGFQRLIPNSPRMASSRARIRAF